MALVVNWIGLANVDCNGTFEQAGVISSTTGSYDVTFGAAGVGAGTFEGLRVSPTVLKNVGPVGKAFRIRGKLLNPCAGGTIVLNANGEQFGVDIKPNRACASLNGNKPRADANGKFLYTLACRCCAGAGAWDVLHDMPMSDNIAKSSPNPPQFACANGVTMVLIRGRLLDPSRGGVDVYGLSRDNSIICKVPTKVLPFGE